MQSLQRRKHSIMIREFVAVRLLDTHLNLLAQLFGGLASRYTGASSAV